MALTLDVQSAPFFVFSLSWGAGAKLASSFAAAIQARMLLYLYRYLYLRLRTGTWPVTNVSFFLLARSGTIPDRSTHCLHRLPMSFVSYTVATQKSFMDRFINGLAVVAGHSTRDDGATERDGTGGTCSTHPL